MNPSERIRVALSRSDTTRQSTTTVPAVESKPEVEETLRLLADADEHRTASSPATTVVAQTTPTHRVAPKPEISPVATTDPAINRSRRHYLIMGVLALIAVAAVVTRDYWMPLMKPKPPAAPTLQVEVKSEGNGLLNVRWNPESAVVTQAREGRLSILEANQQPRVVTLQPEQLRSGHLYYQSTAERLEFQLEVVSMTGATVKETVLALSSSKPSPDGPQASNAAPTAQQLAQPQNVQPAPTRQAAQTTTPAPVGSKPDRSQPQVEATNRPPQQPDTPAARTFTPPPMTTRRVIEDSHSVVLDPSSTPTAGIAPARIDLPQGIGNIPAPPPVKPPVGQAPSATQAPAVAHKIGGAVEPAVLVKKVAPQYPAFAKASHVEGVVRFTATVDKEGKVQNVQVVNGPPLLTRAAEEAVKQWVYRPMMLDGKPTDVVTQIEVRFALRQ